MLKAGMSCPFSRASNTSELELSLVDISGGGCVTVVTGVTIVDFPLSCRILAADDDLCDAALATATATAAAAVA